MINVFAGILNNYIFVAVLTATVLFQVVINYLRLPWCITAFAIITQLTLTQWFVSILFDSEVGEEKL